MRVEVQDCRDITEKQQGHYQSQKMIEIRISRQVIASSLPSLAITGVSRLIKKAVSSVLQQQQQQQQQKPLCILRTPSFLKIYVFTYYIVFLLQGSEKVNTWLLALPLATNMGSLRNFRGRGVCYTLIVSLLRQRSSFRYLGETTGTISNKRVSGTGCVYLSG